MGTGLLLVFELYMLVAVLLFLLNAPSIMRDVEVEGTFQSLTLFVIVSLVCLFWLVLALWQVSTQLSAMIIRERKPR